MELELESLLQAGTVQQPSGMGAEISSLFTALHHLAKSGATSSGQQLREVLPHFSQGLP